MKKNMAYGALLLFPFSAAFAQQKFVIKVELANQGTEKKIMLTYAVDGSYKMDSAVTSKGAFSLSGSVPYPTRGTLEVRPLVQDTTPMTMERYMARDVQELYLEAGSISIKGNSLKTAEIKGGKSQQEYLVLVAGRKPFQDSISLLATGVGAAMQSNDNKTREELLKYMPGLRRQVSNAEDAFVKSHPDSYVSLDLLYAGAAIIDPVAFAPVFNALSTRMKNTVRGKDLATRLAAAEKTAVGKTAFVFTQNTTDEKPFTLTSLRGKYVLVDFWASWCHPCREENPNVVKAYNAFKDKNFEIVGVSLDDNKGRWVDAIEKDQLPWIHVSDLKGWRNAVAAAYGVNAVPQNFLINPDGVIIAKNLRGEDLFKKLPQLLK